MPEPFDEESFAERERLAMQSEQPVVTSPDGRIRIEYESHEMRMSHWIRVPHVFDVPSGRLIYKPESGIWDGEHEWGESGKVTLHIARYPDAGNRVSLHFDLHAGIVRLDGIENAAPITEANRIAQREFDRRDRTATSAAPLPGPAAKPVNLLLQLLWGSTWARFRSVLIAIALAILVGMATGWLPLTRWVSGML